MGHRTEMEGDEWCQNCRRYVPKFTHCDNGHEPEAQVCCVWAGLSTEEIAARRASR